MKVCVLGATGATGQWVTKMLLDKGYEVTVYQNSQNTPTSELTLFPLGNA